WRGTAMPRAPPRVRKHACSSSRRCLAELARLGPRGALPFERSLNRCTRANRRSVPDSLHALIGSVAAFTSAVVMLVMAMITVPLRLVRPSPTKHGKPASIDHVEVQVHLGNRERVGAIEHTCHAALKR